MLLDLGVYAHGEGKTGGGRRAGRLAGAHRGRPRQPTSTRFEFFYTKVHDRLLRTALATGQPEIHWRPLVMPKPSVLSEDLPMRDRRGA